MIRTEKTRRSWATKLMVAVLAVAGCMTGASTASATGTDKSENLIIATGILDGGNTNTRKFFAQYTAPSVATDLNVPKGRNPKYTLVTGLAAFKAGGGVKLGQCVIYVAEESSGNMVAYAVPWDAGAMSRTANVNAAFVKIGVVKVGAGGPAAAGGAVEEGEK
jgi:hypothetical protein